MAFTAFSRSPARRAVLAALFALVTLPALAGTESSHGSYTTEMQVDRLLWALVNDERFSHLRVAANYERLRTQLIEQACLVSATPCLQTGETLQHTRGITAEMSPEQDEAVKQLLFTLHSASASATEQPGRLMVTASK